MNTLELTIHHMSCGHCVGQVTKALRELDGVIVNRVTVGTARVSYDPAITTPPRIVQAVKEAGYEAVMSGRAYDSRRLNPTAPDSIAPGLSRP